MCLFQARLLDVTNAGFMSGVYVHIPIESGQPVARHPVKLASRLFFGPHAPDTSPLGFVPNILMWVFAVFVWATTFRVPRLGEELVELLEGRSAQELQLNRHFPVHLLSVLNDAMICSKFTCIDYVLIWSTASLAARSTA